MINRSAFVLLVLLVTFSTTIAQITPSPERAEGDGPYKQLIIRGVTLIDGTGAPPTGPVDVVIKGNKIASIRMVGSPGVPIKPNRRPKANPGDKEIDATGMYLLPGFVDAHAHSGGTSKDQSAEYVFKLWMAHGITSIRDVAAGNGLDWVLDHKEKSKKNTITAPRIFAYTSFGQGAKNGINTPEEARAWVQNNAKRGADGIKFFGAAPEIMTAALDENKKLGLRSACHHAQLHVVGWNVLNSARAGLTSMEHWYGLPEAMFDDKVIQDYPADYNYQNEQNRFEEAGKLWQQAAKPGTAKWNEVMDELLSLDFTIVPTFTIYEASRDLMRARRDEWHETYTLPGLWEFFQPSMESHGSYWHFWGTEQEIAWKNNYKIWMQFINEYKNKGGRVAAGSDSGYIFKLFGFGYIRELELLREAGFHPLEVIQAATLKGAELLGQEQNIGTIEVGKLADMVLIDENPLANLKVLYGTGAIKLTEDNEIVRVGGVKYTIKDGIIYDAKKLLEDVEKLVDAEKERRGGWTLKQPGIK